MLGHTKQPLYVFCNSLDLIRRFNLISNCLVYFDGPIVRRTNETKENYATSYVMAKRWMTHGPCCSILLTKTVGYLTFMRFVRGARHDDIKFDLYMFDDRKTLTCNKWGWLYRFGHVAIKRSVVTLFRGTAMGLYENFGDQPHTKRPDIGRKKRKVVTHFKRQ